MSDRIVTPGASNGDISEPTKKAVGGWKEIQARRSGQPPQQRVIKESAKLEQPVARESEANDEFDMRRAKQHMQKLTEQKLSEKVFKGNATQIALKLKILTEGAEADSDVGSAGIRGGNKVKILHCEDAGFGQFKLTYLLEN